MIDRLVGVRMVDKMKRLFILIAMIFALNACAGSNFKVYVNNIDVQRISKMEPKQAIGGIIVALGMHEFGHIVAAKAFNANVSMRGPFHVRWNKNSLSDKEKVMVNRSGYLLQTLFGTALNYIPTTKGSDFTLSYNLTSCAQMLSQPLFRGKHKYNDLNMLDKNGGNAMLEWSGYTLWSGINLYTSLKKEN